MKRLLLFFCCLTITGAAQEVSLQELVNRKQFAQVVSRTDSLTQADSANYTTMYAIGQAYEGLLRYPMAYNYYKYCLTMDTTNVDILNTLARMATNLGRATDAQHYFNQVLASDSTNFYANYQLGRLYQQLGEYGEAIKKYEFLLTNDETNPVLLRQEGDCYTRMDELQAAEACYHLAYQYNKENASLASTLINTMLRLGGESAKYALTVCDTALYYNPGNRQLEQNKAMTLYMNKRYAEADTLYTQLMEAGDSTFLTVKYAGVSRYHAGQYMNAIEPLEVTYERDTTQADICLLLGSALGKTYDRKRAFVLLDKAEENLKPEPVYLRQLLRFRAETYHKDGDIDTSDRLYYAAWKEEPENLDLLGFLITRYNVPHVEFYNSEKSRQKGIFLRVLYIRECLKANEIKSSFPFQRYFLESLYTDMFFRSVTEEPMLAPDGKKSKLNVHDLRFLINQLPEMETDEKEKMDNYAEERRVMEEKLRKDKEERLKKEKENVK